ncbi:MAG: hypothetical protein QMD25_02625 [Caldisericia bacterium]|jgi:GTPase SAR1 family protein|nr:hypothetical protein [Caldisericia bacterium]
MDIIQKLRENNIKILSIIGLSKNCGKTTTLNKLIELLEKENKKVCITSIGIDGESFDHLFLFEKPKIHLKENFYVVTSIESIKDKNLEFFILKKFGIYTSKGELILIKLEKEGDVEVSGPYIGKDLQRVLDELNEFNFDIILIDGAIDRKVSIKYSDGIILQTGLNIIDKKEEIVEETVFYKEIFSLPEIYDEIKDRIRKKINEKQLKKINKLEDDFVFINGALTDSILEELINENIKKVIVEHPYNIFISKKKFYDFKKLDGEIYVLKKVNLLGISFSSFYQEGFFNLDDEIEIFNTLKEKLKPFEIFDPIKGR